MTLEEQFQRDMYDGYELLKRECHYNATYFLQMLRERGGVGTAKRLLVSQELQTGLTRLWEEGQLLNSMENAVCQRKLPNAVHNRRNQDGEETAPGFKLRAAGMVTQAGSKEPTN